MRIWIALIAIVVSCRLPPLLSRAGPSASRRRRAAPTSGSPTCSPQADREQLENAFRAMLARMGAAGADAQCPMPREDKTEAVNAEFEAEEFNRRLGANLHAAPIAEFPPRR